MMAPCSPDAFTPITAAVLGVWLFAAAARVRAEEGITTFLAFMNAVGWTLVLVPIGK